MKKYRASFGKIKCLEVVKETPKTVVFINWNGNQLRENKESSYYSWHDTKEEAIEYMISKINIEIVKHKNYVSSLEEDIERIKNL